MYINEWSDRAVARLSAAALCRNVREIRRRLPEKTLLCAVVKADAYGHGAVQTARILKAEGVPWLAVATAGEAMELRTAGITGPLLVLGVTPVSFVEIAGREDISLTVHEAAFGQALKAAAANAGVRVKIHIKLDTGMTRLGLSTAPAEVSDTAASIRDLFFHSCLEPEGLFSHFASSESDAAFSAEQTARYMSVCNRLSDLGFAVRHIGNSGALGKDELTAGHGPVFNMWRIGILLYGGQPDPETPVSGLEPVMSVFGRIVQIRTLSQTETVGYNRTVSLPAGTRTAVVEIGYADGVSRRWPEPGFLLLHGQKAPIVGRVSMDRLVINISGVEAATGDYALYFGRDGAFVLTADEVASRAGTISYELFCRITARVPRVWDFT